MTADVAGSRPPVVIVGGGIAGLSAGATLARRGLPSVIFEREGRLGGRPHSVLDVNTQDLVDIGPHVLADAYANMRSFLQHLGSESLVHWQHDELITLVNGPRAVGMKSHRLPAPFPLLPSFLKDPEISFLQKLSGWRCALEAMSMDEERVLALDRVTGIEYLHAKGVHPRFIDGFWRSLSMFLLNIPLERCSAGALMRLAGQLLGHGHAAFGFPKVGLGQLFCAQATNAIEAAGGRVQLNAVAVRLEIAGDRLTALHLDDGSRIPATHCIVALPPVEARDLLPGTVFPGRLRSIAPCPYVSCYLWFRRRLSSRRFWARRWRAGALSCEYYDLANIRRFPARRGSLLATNLIDAGAIHPWDDSSILRAVLFELEEFLPDCSRDLEHHRIHRIPMAIPRASAGFESVRPQTRTDIDRLYLAGDWTRTGLPCSMESATRSGHLAADAVLGSVGLSGNHALPIPEPQGLVRLIRPVLRSLDTGLR